mgnify:CR=1 FL=1
MLPSIFSENLFDDFFGDSFEKNFFGEHNPLYGKRAKNLMKTDVKETESGYEVAVDLPGFKKEDIQLQLDGDTLTIQAQRHSEHEEQEKKGKYVCCERSYGAYSRSFDVSGIRAEGITASYDSGVLTLKLPKKTVEVSSSRQISID